MDILKNNVPTKTTSPSNKQPWITKLTKRLCRKKLRWFKKTKTSNSARVLNKYKQIKKDCERACRQAKLRYLERLSEPGNEKLFYGYVKSKKRDNVSNNFLKDKHGIVHDTPSIKAKLFNEQFTSVFSKPIDKHFDFPVDFPKMPDININVNGVLKLLKSVNPHKATGPDGIPPYLIKELAQELAPIFRILFQASVDQGTIPQDWKKAYIIPIYKKSDPLKAENYRPVSLTPVPCKLLEHIIHSNIMKHLDKHNILCHNQHGFRKGKSCETQLIGIVDDLASSLNNNEQTDLIFLDFSKAFDKVNHSTLLKKALHYGIDHSVLFWLESFLSGRTQQVQLEGTLSDPSDVLSGVPQGTVLGPLLFLIYINDLPQFVSEGTNVRLFADDSALYRKIKTPNDHLILQRDLDSLVEWENRNCMEFHPGKCELLRISTKREHNISKFNYSIHNTVIEATKHAKYLGVTIMCNLQWNYHIECITKKASNTLGFVQRNFKNCPRNIKEKLYKSYVRPGLEYASSVWDPFTGENIGRIERVQRRAARCVTSVFGRDQSVSALLEELKWQPLQERRARAKLILAHKGINHVTDIPFNYPTVSCGTRGHVKNNFYIPFSRLDTHKYSFYPSTLRLWNNIPPEIRNLPTADAFASGLDRYSATQSILYQF